DDLLTLAGFLEPLRRIDVGRVDQHRDEQVERTGEVVVITGCCVLSHGRGRLHSVRGRACAWCAAWLAARLLVAPRFEFVRPVADIVRPLISLAMMVAAHVSSSARRLRFAFRRSTMSALADATRAALLSP